MTSTGQINGVSGIYRAGCACGYEIALSQGEKFPPCRTVHGAVQWILVRRTQH